MKGIIAGLALGLGAPLTAFVGLLFSSGSWGENHTSALILSATIIGVAGSVTAALLVGNHVLNATARDIATQRATPIPGAISARDVIDLETREIKRGEAEIKSVGAALRVLDGYAPAARPSLAAPEPEILDLEKEYSR